MHESGHLAWSEVLFKESSGFERTAVWTLGITFFLIFVGGLVRAAGAGLGCPDWPRCFGLWIPPLTADALPPPYDPAEFNVFKTWLEYVNRLVGVAVGAFILVTFVRSIRFFRRNPPVFAGALAALLLVLFQGWLGGQVVRSGLAGWMITIHMLVAVLILNVLLFTWFMSVRERLTFPLSSPLQRKLLWGVSLLIGVTLFQVVLGSQVREALSHVMATLPELARAEWLSEVGRWDPVHRSFSWLVLGASIYVYRVARTFPLGHALRELAVLNNTAVVLQILLGVGLAYMGLPPALQIFHLVVAAFMTSVQFLALLMVTAAPRGR